MISFDFLVDSQRELGINFWKFWSLNGTLYDIYLPEIDEILEIKHLTAAGTMDLVGKFLQQLADTF